MIVRDTDVLAAVALDARARGETICAFVFRIFAQIELPLPPSANRYWRQSRRAGQLHRSPDAVQYIERVRALLWEAGWTKPTDGRFILLADIYMTRGDLGNREKVLSDALQGMLYEDDEQIIQIHLIRHWARIADQRVVLSLVQPMELQKEEDHVGVILGTAGV